jgi:hypothetical protein
MIEVLSDLVTLRLRLSMQIVRYLANHSNEVMVVIALLTFAIIFWITKDELEREKREALRARQKDNNKR